MGAQVFLINPDGTTSEVHSEGPIKNVLKSDEWSWNMDLYNIDIEIKTVETNEAEKWYCKNCMVLHKTV